MDNKEIFIEWERLVKSIRDFNEQTSDSFHNAPYALQKCKDLLEFMKKETPQLREWCNRYLEEHRDEIYAKFWINKGWNFFNVSNSGTGNLRFPSREEDLHPEFIGVWERIRSLIGKSQQNDFQFAYTNLKEAHRIHSIEFCNLPEILMIHEGKECISNGWYCDYCDDMEYKWHSYLLENLKKTNNVFLNKSVKEEFLQKCIKSNLAPFGWKPPITQTRVEPIEVETNGKTATQIMYSIVKFASWQIQLWTMRIKDEYQRFCELWEFIENLEPKLEVLEGACRQVEEIVNHS